MHSTFVLRSHTKTVLQLLCACICTTATAVLAEPVSNKAGGAQYGAAPENMQLHLARFLSAPRSKPGNSLGSLKLMWNDDDCDEDELAWLGRGRSDTVVDSAPLRTSKSIDGTQLAKLDSSRSGSESRLSDADVSVPVLAAAPKKASTSPANTGAATVAAPATVAPAPAEAPKLATSWEIIPADKTLNTSLARWAAAAGWQLVWELPVDYAVEARTSVPGTFEQAVEIVAKSMETAEIPMKAIFYKGNKVLRIVAKGGE